MNAVCALPVCPRCDVLLRLQPGRFGRFYGCPRYPACRCTCAAWDDGAPKGEPSTPEVKAARVRAHVAFDALWSKGWMRRGAAYEWLAGALGLSLDDAHIARFDEATCEHVVTLSHAKLNDLKAEALKNYSAKGRR